MPVGTITSSGALVGRMLVAALFVAEGLSKLKGYGAAAAYMERFGVPGALLPAVLLLELGGGILLVAGWRTRWVALALSLFCILAAVLFHASFADRNQLLHFEKDLAIAGGLLLLAVFGAGPFSIDGRRDA